jgi:hypothetical protein
MSLISLETSRQNQVKEKPRYQNVLGNGLERSQRPPIKGEKGRGKDRRSQTLTDADRRSRRPPDGRRFTRNDTSPSHITYPHKTFEITNIKVSHFSKCLSA